MKVVFYERGMSREKLLPCCLPPLLSSTASPNLPVGRIDTLRAADSEAVLQE
jgi:hypothetical protein